MSSFDKDNRTQGGSHGPKQGKVKQFSDIVRELVIPIMVALIGAYAVLIAADKVANPFGRDKASAPTEQTAPIAGIWTGIISSPDRAFETEVLFSIQPDCVLGRVCGTYDTPALGCKGDLIFKGVTQDIFEFTESKSTNAADSCDNNGIDRFVSVSEDQLNVSYLYNDELGIHSSSGILIRK